MSHKSFVSSASALVPPSPPGSGPERLAGRDTHVRQLEDLLDEALRGRPRVVLLTGEPGIGKTRLMEELAERARSRCCATMSGRAAEFEEVPFGVFAEALAPLWQPKSNVDIDPYVLYRQVTGLLGDLAADRGLVLLLDDLHWADEGSIGLIDYLLRHLPDAPLLVAMAFRELQAPVRLRGTLSHVPAVIELPPLSQAEMDELIPADTSMPRKAALYRGSGGNPFYLDILLRDATHTDVSAALKDELAALSTSESAVAQAAAIAGDAFDPELVSLVASVAVPDVLTCLDELARRDLVRPDGAGRRLRFRHPLLRNAVYHAIDAESRREGHARAADHLREIGADATTRAHHVERAAQPGDEDAIATLVEAAEHVVSTVPALAAHWCGAAVALLGPGQRRAELALRQAGAIAATGDYTTSRDLTRTVLADLDPSHPGPYAAAMTLCAGLERLLGDYDAATALLHSALDRVADNNLSVAMLKGALAELYARAGKLPEALNWVLQAQQAAAGHEDLIIVSVGAAGLLALGHAYAGDNATATAHLDYAGPLLDGVTDHELAGHLPAAGLAWAEIAVHRFGDARRHFARGVTLARRTGQHFMLPMMLCGLASAEIWLGSLADAAEHAADATEFARALDDVETVPIALGSEAEVAYLRGDFDAAARWAREAIARRPDGEFLWAGFAEGVLAKVMLAGGDPDGCVEQLLQAGGDAELSHYVPGMRASWFDVLVQAELARGRVDSAAEWADRSQAMESFFAVKYTHAISRARVLVASGDYEGAAAHAALALEYVVSIGAPVAEADHRRVLAAALAGAGEIDRAEEELRRAKALAATCGAMRLHAEVAAEQRRVAAARPRSRTGLTSREREIAGLVAVGRTNKQIALELAISPRTVENHMARIFAKFDVTSRAGVARRLAEDTYSPPC